MLYLGIFLFIILLILLYPVNISINLHINDRALDINIKFFLFKRIMIFKKSLVNKDVLDIQKNKKKTVQNDVDTKEKKVGKWSKVPLLGKINIITDVYCSNKQKFSRLKGYIQRRFKMKETAITISEGTGDAAQTALLYGSLWSLIGSLSSLLSNFITVSFSNIKLNCDYYNKTFKANISCIFSFSIVNIIIVFLRLYYIVKKYKLM